ncbi:MAG: FIST N-terminal domain-containing protein [Phycisphaerales bacterium]|jgi:small ligand-binding sensory domain FIST|nr:FIST N-terminal domain-containing protein [Phycisphaerales bacterium]
MMRSAAAISEHLDTRTAALEVAQLLSDAMAGPCDLVLIFASFHHRASLPEAAATIRGTVGPCTVVGVTAESVVGCDLALEGVAGLSALGLHLPGVTITPWRTHPEKPLPLSRPQEIPEWIGLRDDSVAVLLFADPFSTPITRMLPALVSCRGEDEPFLPVLGGIASGASQADYNNLVLDGGSWKRGAVGLTLSGPLDLETIVSQGCRPIGEAMVVTRSEGNVILELGGHPAMEAVRRLAEGLSDEERSLLDGGVLLGSVIDEQRDHFGRGDFLVRNILGYDRKRGGIAAAELLRPGRTVQLHVRDAQTAAEDLHLLLDAQQMSEPPFAGMLVTCNGRGRGLFGEDDHDLTVIRDRLGEVPISGFFAAGEIGPIGGRSFLHGHTACLTLFR